MYKLIKHDNIDIVSDIKSYKLFTHILLVG